MKYLLLTTIIVQEGKGNDGEERVQGRSHTEWGEMEFHSSLAVSWCLDSWKHLVLWEDTQLSH